MKKKKSQARVEAGRKAWASKSEAEKRRILKRLKQHQFTKKNY